MSCSKRIQNFEFEPSEIQEAVKNGRLLSMEIEFSLKCNFKCPYCYLPDESYFKGELGVDEIKNVLVQAKELGAKKIIILGGEPMVYPKIFEMLEFITQHGMIVEMFTNGYNITEENAKRLFDLKINVVLKMNTSDKHLQDKLSGQEGASKQIEQSLNNLRTAGYPTKDPFLAISTIICKDNIKELPQFWRWLRDNEILPYFEMLTPQGEATKNSWLNVSSAEVEDLFNEISLIDENEYDNVWEVQPPLVGNACLRHQFSCLVNSKGFVMPCVGVTIPVGNIREKKLKDIIADSEVIQKLRHYKENIKGPCGQCEKAEECYGCRGAAYNLTGDYLGSDPLCWKNLDKADEIIKLPTSVKGIIPHENSMLLIDSLTYVGERKAKTTVEITAENIFVNSNGVLDSVVFPEMAAQSLAAMQGFIDMASGRVLEGFLLGIKKFKVYKEVRVGDLLEITVFKTTQFGEFGLVDFDVYCDNSLVAEGEIKVWQKK
jgi:radical SAM protein with 4Fe4S-binding SPASM domain